MVSSFGCVRGMGVAVDFVPKRALSSSCFLAFSEQSTQDQNLMYVPVRHSTAPLAVARGTPISIATPDGTPVSLETLSADAVFIARVGGKPPVEEFPCAPEMLDARNSLELMQYPKTHTNRFAALSDDGSSSVELNSESGSEIKLPLKTSASTLPRDLACLQSEDKLQHTASSYVEGIPFVGSHWDCPIQSVRKRRTPSSAATSSTTSSMTSSPVRSIPPLLSGIQEDVETLEQELNTHNLSEYVGTPGLRRTNSGGTENGVASSVATSAFTLQSTFHSRQRAQERDIKRIEIKSALKNGIPRRSVTGNWVVDDGTTCVVVASEDMVGGVSVAHASSTQKSRVVSAWKKPLFPIRGKGPLWTDC